jgi:crotonobetainyl-CoA:carnitine CoA-transferase CaiB-like acyl-CoA transferase
MNDDLLAGILIIDLSQGVAAAYCGRLLAGCGAEVIKVRPPGAGDSSPASDPEGHLDSGKKGITLDYARPSGAALLRRLVEGADALIEDHAPDHLESLGLGYQDLSAVNPRLIVVSVASDGAGGPFAERLIGLNALAATLTGLLSAAGIDRGQHIEVAGSGCLAAAGSLPGVDPARAPSPPLDTRGSADVMGFPLKAGRAPTPGEHNEEVYRGMLRLTQEDLLSLREEGTV